MICHSSAALIFSKDILVHMLLMNKRLFWYGIWIEITVQFSNIKCINTCHPQFYQPAILCLSWWNSALYLPYATVTNAMKQFNEMIPFVNQIMTLFKKSIIRSAIFSIIYHMSYFSVLSTYNTYNIVGKVIWFCLLSSLVVKKKLLEVRDTSAWHQKLKK